MKIMILGASDLQVPAILKAKEMGLDVAVCDYNMDAIGIKYADKFYNVSTLDKDAVLNACQQYKAQAIFTMATDKPMDIVAEISNQLDFCNLNSVLSIRTCTNKSKLLTKLGNSGIEVPWFYVINSYSDIDEIEELLSFPCIIKPIDSSGSRGVIKVESISDLREKFAYTSSFSSTNEVLIEEFLQGKEVSVEAITYEGKTTVVAITDKTTTNEPYFVELEHNQPTKLPYEEIQLIKNYVEECIRVTGLRYTPTHTEIMMTSSGPRIIELGPRLGGDCITSHLVPLSTGVDIIEESIKIAIGKPINIKAICNNHSMIHYFTPKYGVVKSIEGLGDTIDLDGVEKIHFNYSVGNRYNALTSSNGRFGYVILQHDNEDDLKKLLDLVKSSIHIVVDTI